MSIQIENVPVTPKFTPKGHSGAISTKELCELLRTLKVGQSFVVPVLNSSGRNVLGIASKLLERRFSSTADERGIRIGRVE